MAIGIWGKPAQLDIQPYDKEFMLRAADAVQKRRDQVDTDLSSLSGIASAIQGGYRTSQRAKAYRDKVMGQVSSLYDQMQKTGNVAGGGYAIKQLAEKIKSDPEYLTIKQDEAVKPEIFKLINDQGFDNHVQDWYDKDHGFAEAQGNFDPSWYKSTAPGDVKEFKPYFDQIKQQITREYSQQGIPVETYTDPKGLVHVRNRYDGKTIKTITPDQVHDLFLNLASKDPSFQGLQTFNYAKDLFNQEAKKAGYDQQWENTNAPSRMAEIATANFLGYTQDEQDTTPIFKDEVSGTATTSDSNSTSNKSVKDLYPNPYLTVQEELDNTGNGTFNDIKALASMANGSSPDEKEGTFKLNLANKKVQLNVVDPTLNTEQNNENTNKVNFGGKIKSLLSKYDNLTNSQIIEEAKRLNPKYSNIKIDGSTGKIIAQEDVGQGMFKSTKSTILGSVQDIKSKIKWNLIKQLPEYNKIKADAEKVNIQIENPEFLTSVETAAKDPKTALLYDLSIGIQNAKGTVNFRPLADKNIFSGNDGSTNLAGTAEVSQTQLYNMLGTSEKESAKRVKQALDAGLVTLTSPATDKKQATYEININTPINFDVPKATEAYYNQGSEDMRKQAQYQIDLAKQKTSESNTNNAAYLTLRPIVEKNPQVLTDNINSNLNILKRYDANTASTLESMYNDAITALSKESDRGKKIKLYGLINSIMEDINKRLSDKHERMLKLGEREGGSGTLAPPIDNGQ